MPTGGKELKGRAQVRDRHARDAVGLEADQVRELELRRRRDALIRLRLEALQEDEARLIEAAAQWRAPSPLLNVMSAAGAETC
mgnify:CR=1 FL=1